MQNLTVHYAQNRAAVMGSRVATYESVCALCGTDCESPVCKITQRVPGLMFPWCSVVVTFAH